MKKDSHIYCDYAASTPVDPVVLRAMQPYFSECFGNAGSVHTPGQTALSAVDRSRETIAGALGARFHEVIFTGSATEANNLALRGALAGWRRTHGERMIPRVVISAVEHGSIYETAKALERDGFAEVVVVPVDKEGFVDERKLLSSLNKRTALVSIIYASNEIGTIQRIKHIGMALENYRREKNVKDYPLFHTDAVQAFQYCDTRVTDIHVDMLSISAQKIYGPKGAGALYIRASAQKYVVPIMTGGEQEFGLRASTENVPAIVGFSKAVEIVEKKRARETKRIQRIRDHFWRELQKAVPSAILNGASIESGERLPHTCNACFPGYDAYDVLVALDLRGISVSAGSACTARSVLPSRVLLALRVSEAHAKESLRFSFGRDTTEKEVDVVVREMKSLTANHGH